jgi:hypothetical protein
MLPEMQKKMWGCNLPIYAFICHHHLLTLQESDVLILNNAQLLLLMVMYNFLFSISTSP